MGLLEEVSCVANSAGSPDSKLGGDLSAMTRFDLFSVADSSVCSWAPGILIFKVELSS